MIPSQFKTDKNREIIERAIKFYSGENWADTPTCIYLEDRGASYTFIMQYRIATNARTASQGFHDIEISEFFEKQPEFRRAVRIERLKKFLELLNEDDTTASKTEAG